MSFRSRLSRLSARHAIRQLEKRLADLEAERDQWMVSDTLYAAIEDRFRGSTDLIRARQERYLPHLVGVTDERPLLDLGSGRGEWLDLLEREGVPASGVDSNAGFVASCRSRGLHVTHGDLYQVLAAVPPGSLGGVSMIQVAEHLPLSVLEAVLEEAHRALADGGVFIVEIPNIETLRVGAATFWIDPTHRRPIFPEFLVLLVERAGFATVQRDFSTPLSETPPDLDSATGELWSRVNGPGDFAVIARK